MLYLFDDKQNYIQELYSSELQALKQTEILNGLMSIDFEIFSAYYEKMEGVSYVGHKDMENKDKFHLYKITHSTTTNDGISYNGVHIIFDDLQNYGYLKDERLDKTTAESALQTIVAGTDWTVGNCSDSPIKKIHFYDISRLDALKSLLQTWNLELEYNLTFNKQKTVSKTVSLKKRLGTDTGERFVYGSNALEVTREINQSEVVSRIVPRGKRIRDTEAYKETVENKKNYENAKVEAQRDRARIEQQAIEQRDKLLGIRTAKPTKTETKKVTASDIMGPYDEDAYPEKVEITQLDWKPNTFVPINKPKGQEYIELEEITKKFGYPDGTPRTKVVEFTDIEDPDELMERAYQALVQMSRPLVDFKTKVLKKTSTYMGDRVAIIRRDLELYYTTRVFKIVRDLLKQSYEIEFGDGISTKSYNPNLSKRITLEELHEDATSQKEFVREVQDLLTEKMYNQDGYNYELDAGNEYQLPAGYYSFNRAIDDNPTKAIYVGAGMMAIANSHKGNGDWDWRSFGTGDGFVADLIVAGMLRGGKVRWNLETGTFLIGDDAENYSMWWDGATLHLRDVDIDLVNNPQIEKMNKQTKNELIERLNKERAEIDKNNDVIINDIKDLRYQLSITDSGIESKASQIREEVLRDSNNMVTERLNEVESSFTQRADGFERKVSSIERQLDPNGYNTIGSRLTKAESKITQTSNSLSSEIQGIDNKYNRLSNQLTQTERQLSSKISENDVYSLIQQMPSYVKIQARNIDLTGDVTIQGELKTVNSSLQPNIYVHGSKIDFFQQKSHSYPMGTISPIKYSGTDNYYLNLRHNGVSAITISYPKSRFGFLTDNDSDYLQYVRFDRYGNVNGNQKAPIEFYEKTYFGDDVTLDYKLLLKNKLEIGSASSGQIYFQNNSSGGYALTFDTSNGSLFVNKKSGSSWKSVGTIYRP